MSTKLKLETESELQADILMSTKFNPDARNLGFLLHMIYVPSDSSLDKETDSGSIIIQNYLLGKTSRK